MTISIPIKHGGTTFGCIVSTSRKVGYVSVNGCEVPIDELLIAIDAVSLPDDTKHLAEKLQLQDV